MIEHYSAASNTEIYYMFKNSIEKGTDELNRTVDSILDQSWRTPQEKSLELSHTLHKLQRNLLRYKDKLDWKDADTVAEELQLLASVTHHIAKTLYAKELRKGDLENLLVEQRNNFLYRKTSTQAERNIVFLYEMLKTVENLYNPLLENFEKETHYRTLDKLVSGKNQMQTQPVLKVYLTKDVEQAEKTGRETRGKHSIDLEIQSIKTGLESTGVRFSILPQKTIHREETYQTGDRLSCVAPFKVLQLQPETLQTACLLYVRKTADFETCVNIAEHL